NLRLRQRVHPTPRPHRIEGGDVAIDVQVGGTVAVAAGIAAPPEEDAGLGGVGEEVPVDAVADQDALARPGDLGETEDLVAGGPIPFLDGDGLGVETPGVRGIRRVVLAVTGPA